MKLTKVEGYAGDSDDGSIIEFWCGPRRMTFYRDGLLILLEDGRGPTVDPADCTDLFDGLKWLMEAAPQDTKPVAPEKVRGVSDERKV